MAYKEILVLADHTAAGRARVEFAARIAAQTGAELRAVFPVGEFLRFFGEAAGPAPESLASDFNLKAPQGEGVPAVHRQAEEHFNAQLSKFKLAGKWLEVDGEIDRPLLSLARMSDLVITSRAIVTPYGENRLTADQLGLSCGGPVIVVPPEMAISAPVRRILVAWADKREAARALRDAWPLIETADEVALVSVGEPLHAAKEALQERFDRHGKAVSIAELAGSDRAAPDLILDHAASCGADLLVMGLCGHLRVQQWLLGGMTSEMFARCPLPLLASR